MPTSVPSLAPRITSLQSKISRLRNSLSKNVMVSVENLLKQENMELEKQVAELQEQIRSAEMLLGIKQYYLPASVMAASVDSSVHLCNGNGDLNSFTGVHAPVTDKPIETKQKEDSSRVGPKSKPTGKSANAGGGTKAAAEGQVDVGRLDMRVGRIVEVERHPDADALYVEKVDIGDGKLLTVVSGLVKFCSLESLQNRVGIFMCNLKPVKMRGVESEAMLMCASAPEAGGVEPLILEPSDIQLGDSVIVEGYSHNPDAQLNPKKKIFEQVKPDLRVDASGFACYRGVRWTLRNNPTVAIKASKLRDVQIA